jgi:membrane dipeptidase
LKKIIFVAGIGLILLGCDPGPKTPEEMAKKIHEKVLTVDSHTDTPWALLEGGFDLDIRHDFEKDKSRVDFPRMKEGGLDAVFMAAFVGQRHRDEEGNKKAKELVVRTIDSIRVHIAARTSTAGIAFTPDDAYRLEKQGKRIVFIGIENGYAIGNDIRNIEEFYYRRILRQGGKVHHLVPHKE